jgi:uncharacterized protein involved in exopolysaccharide biosynthesis
MSTTQQLNNSTMNNQTTQRHAELVEASARIAQIPRLRCAPLGMTEQLNSSTIKQLKNNNHEKN